MSGPEGRAMPALHATIHGRVQGVGYRYFVLRHASKLGLTGWVRNLADGTVEVWAEGTKPSLDALTSQLETGPVGSRVDRVDADRPETERGYHDFAVR